MTTEIVIRCSHCAEECITADPRGVPEIALALALEGELRARLVEHGLRRFRRAWHAVARCGLLFEHTACGTFSRLVVDEAEEHGVRAVRMERPAPAQVPVEVRHA